MTVINVVCDYKYKPTPTEKRMKTERPQRAEILKRGIEENQTKAEITQALEKANLYCTSQKVKQWIDYYRGEM